MTPKLVIMIPARYGSKRVPKKNLRLIDGKPLISYVIEQIKNANIPADVYINSEHEIFGKVAKDFGVKFYKRPEKHSSDTSTNDEFALDFMNAVPADILIQVLPTSPLLTGGEIKKFVDEMVNGKWDSLISVEHKQIACVYKNQPVNFEKLKVNPPSQTMEPVKAYATALMGWTYPSFKRNMEKYGSAYHGGDGKTGYFELRGLSTIDIDREDDFKLAESIIKALRENRELPIRYYGENTT